MRPRTDREKARVLRAFFVGGSAPSTVFTSGLEGNARYGVKGLGASGFVAVSGVANR